ncbi:uncharacterized protein LACBIDRAFT_307010 [Laccaria bicolor S238N-H82]|uniref:Predicted protein n=1 Tax=Laccaria bicolor (strain S238N-H82 / ATCC MYA-4686) TaxID=486041 RepID=B0DP61_LACBS|nr:uncharacterized protein LACBIDRAFT_307010 [Laccaria bicolor S238N-H82]EDR03557.1 predicted protein [Laccaria bicolor S238N-H82]|eukprot:XP_001885705.1 predicted protein [Laccaria bicolor S238N-H82]
MWVPPRGVLDAVLFNVTPTQNADPSHTQNLVGWGGKGCSPHAEVLLWRTKYCSALTTRYVLTS